MNVSMRLQVRQTQSLTMTPQLLQSIRLLQYSHLDLQDFLQREADRNPLIELAGGPAGSQPRPVAPASKAAAPQRTRERSSAHTLGALPSIDLLAAETPSLCGHALTEIAAALPSADDRRIAEALLIDLDEIGYLRVDLAQASRSLGVDPERIARILSALRREAEPAGLFAGDLAECLALQLERRGRLDPVIQAVLSRLDLVARRDFAALRRLTGEDEAGLLEILAELRGLDPRPGRMFETAARESVEPDILVSNERGGSWRVELNPATLPRLLVDEDYAAEITQGCRSPDERDFVSRCRTEASWLARSLDQRARSILKVAAEIVRLQEGFLAHGVDGLKPMTLAMVAEAVGMHESTVSRVTANKYAQTPRGTFELKFFFTVAIASSVGGEAHSASGVKERIRRLVTMELPGSVLSDEDIAARLRADGVELARRTVAKYREALGIPSSAQRRREIGARGIAC